MTHACLSATRRGSPRALTGIVGVLGILLAAVTAIAGIGGSVVANLVLPVFDEVVLLGNASSTRSSVATNGGGVLGLERWRRAEPRAVAAGGASVRRDGPLLPPPRPSGMASRNSN